MNLLAGLTNEDMHGLKWLNPPESWNSAGDGIMVYPKAYADFFTDPSGSHIKADAPLLYMDVEGDFVAKALVKPAFQSVWDSVVLMVHAGSNTWAKLCFEWSDAGDGYTGIVSVVTRETSDDANGYPLGAREVWLQLCRVGNAFAMHWSVDGEKWAMARYFGLDCGAKVSVGIAGQCPGGPSVGHEIKYLSIEQRTINNLRKGE